MACYSKILQVTGFSWIQQSDGTKNVHGIWIWIKANQFAPVLKLKTWMHEKCHIPKLLNWLNQFSKAKELEWCARFTYKGVCEFNDICHVVFISLYSTVFDIWNGCQQISAASPVLLDQLLDLFHITLVLMRTPYKYQYIKLKAHHIFFKSLSALDETVKVKMQSLMWNSRCVHHIVHIWNEQTFRRSVPIPNLAIAFQLLQSVRNDNVQLQQFQNTLGWKYILIVQE